MLPLRPARDECGSVFFSETGHSRPGGLMTGMQQLRTFQFPIGLRQTGKYVNRMVINFCSSLVSGPLRMLCR